MADIPNCHQRVSGIEKTADHAIFHYASELTACIVPDHLVLNDVWGETGGVSHAAVVASMGVRVTRQEGISPNEYFSHQDLIRFFKHKLRMKTKADRKRLVLDDSSKRWVHAVSLVHVKGSPFHTSQTRNTVWFSFFRHLLSRVAFCSRPSPS